MLYWDFWAFPSGRTAKAMGTSPFARFFLSFTSFLASVVVRWRLDFPGGFSGVDSIGMVRAGAASTSAVNSRTTSVAVATPSDVAPQRAGPFQLLLTVGRIVPNFVLRTAGPSCPFPFFLFASFTTALAAERELINAPCPPARGMPSARCSVVMMVVG